MDREEGDYSEKREMTVRKKGGDVGEGRGLRDITTHQGRARSAQKTSAYRDAFFSRQENVKYYPASAGEDGLL